MVDIYGGLVAEECLTMTDYRGRWVKTGRSREMIWSFGGGRRARGRRSTLGVDAEAAGSDTGGSQPAKESHS